MHPRHTSSQMRRRRQQRKRNAHINNGCMCIRVYLGGIHSCLGCFCQFPARVRSDPSMESIVLGLFWFCSFVMYARSVDDEKVGCLCLCRRRSPKSSCSSYHGCLGRHSPSGARSNAFLRNEERVKNDVTKRNHTCPVYEGSGIACEYQTLHNTDNHITGICDRGLHNPIGFGDKRDKFDSCVPADIFVATLDPSF